MVKRLLFVMTALAAVALAACAPTGGSESVAETTPAGAEEITLYVGPELVECVGVAPQMCMQVRRDPDGEYELFYNSIEGFAFEEGYNYELRVRVETIANPPADGSSLKYSLVEIVGKTAAAPEEQAAAGLDGTSWQMVSYLNAQGETVNALPDSEVTIMFEGDRIGGSAGCNRYSGSYTAEGDSLTVGPLASTMMACFPEELMQQEAAFLAALQQAASYAIQGEQLQIFNADGQVVITATAVTPVSLTNTNWTAVNVNNGRQAVTGLVQGTQITALFGEDGRLTGSAGCNNYMTGYTLDGDAISIEPPASTRKMCPGEGVMEQEQAFLTLLPTAATFRIDGNSLELRTADGALIVLFTAEAPVAGVTEIVDNAAYTFDDPVLGAVQLVDGEYRAPAAPGSATEIVVQTTDFVATGTLENGQEVAAVVLTVDGGGSGTFYYLAVVDLNAEPPASIATTLLGDRVQINSVVIDESGQIVVDMVTQGPDDPMTSPTQQVTQTYALEDGQLVLVSSEPAQS